MHHHSLSLGLFAIACGLLANATPARALSPETWVSPTGNDAGNVCAITAPCRTFQYAHDKTNNGGSINVLSSGNFGPVTITRSISIVADGVEAVINTPGQGNAAITVQAAAAVSLRGLTIENISGPSINFVSGAVLRVQECVIRKTGSGIQVRPASGVKELYVADSLVADINSVGIGVSPIGNSSVKVVLDRVRVENSSSDGIVFNGFNTSGSINATVRDSVSAGNNGFGIAAVVAGGNTINVTIDRTASVNNAYGIEAQGVGVTIRIGDSTVSGNGTGLRALAGGVIASYGTNKVDGNDIDGSPTTTIAYK